MEKVVLDLRRVATSQNISTGYRQFVSTSVQLTDAQFSEPPPGVAVVGKGNPEAGYLLPRCSTRRMESASKGQSLWGELVLPLSGNLANTMNTNHPKIKSFLIRVGQLACGFGLQPRRSSRFPNMFL